MRFNPRILFFSLTAFFVATIGSPAAPSKEAATGPFPPEIARWTAEIKEKQREAGRRMLAQIEEARKSGAKEIVIPKGDYRFGTVTTEKRPVHISLSGLNNVVLDFQGSTLWFETQYGAFQLINCRNLTFKNVFIDWDPLPFMQGKITDINAKTNTFSVKLDPGYENVSPGMNRTAKPSPEWRGVVFDPKTRELKPGQIGFCVLFSWDKRNADGTYEVLFRGFHDVKVTQSGVSVGDPIVILSRMGRAFRLEDLTDCTLENVTLYSSPFVAFASYAGGNTTFRQCAILKRPGTNRLMAGNADGINVANAFKGPTIENCKMETLGDDFVNIHASLGRVIWQEKSGEIITTRLHNRSEIAAPVTVAFFERATMKPVGRRKAVAVEYLPEWTVESGKCLADIKHKWHSGEASALDIGKTLPAHRLKLDQPLKIEGDVIVVCEEFASPGSVIRNNTFRGTMARGIRQQSPEVLVENNNISLCAGPALTFFGHASFWGEGPYVHTAKTIGNTFSDTGLFGEGKGDSAAIIVREGNYREAHLPYDIVLKNNTIIRPGSAAIVAKGVDRLVIEGNRFESYANRLSFQDNTGKDIPGAGYGVVLESIKGLVLKDNQFIPGKNARGEVFQQDVEP